MPASLGKTFQTSLVYRLLVIVMFSHNCFDISMSFMQYWAIFLFVFECEILFFRDEMFFGDNLLLIWSLMIVFCKISRFLNVDFIYRCESISVVLSTISWLHLAYSKFEIMIENWWKLGVPWWPTFTQIFVKNSEFVKFKSRNYKQNHHRKHSNPY